MIRGPRAITRNVMRMALGPPMADRLSPVQRRQNADVMVRARDVKYTESTSRRTAS
jgi:hypothetical protein